MPTTNAPPSRLDPAGLFAHVSIDGQVQLDSRSRPLVMHVPRLPETDDVLAIGVDAVIVKRVRTEHGGIPLVEVERIDDERLVVERAALAPTHRCTGVAETCPVDECEACSVRDCPHGEPLHYHHDGCPACDVEHVVRPGHLTPVQAEIKRRLPTAFSDIGAAPDDLHAAMVSLVFGLGPDACADDLRGAQHAARNYAWTKLPTRQVPDSEESLALALRVEDAIKRLDARLASSASWRSAVAEWRACVQRFGADSASARGALLGMVRGAWGQPDACTVAYLGDEPLWCVRWPKFHGFFYAARDLDTELEALTVALESAP